jgi:hypothetical protein
MTRKSVELQRLVGNEWRWCCYLIDGADQPGRYGVAADHWVWAKRLLTGRTDYRIEIYEKEQYA